MKNIIFIVLDALRSSNLGCYGYSRKTSPNIDSLAEKGVLFNNFFSSNNATYKSFLSILSGRHLLLDNSKSFFFTGKELSSFFNSGGIFLQEILKKKGYKTFCLKDIYSWQKRGFDFFLSPQKEDGATGLRGKIKESTIFRDFIFYSPRFLSEYVKSIFGRNKAEWTLKKAIELLNQDEKKPFFMWFDLDDTHIPYNPKKFTGKFKSKNDSDNFFKIIARGNYEKEMVRFWKNAFSRWDTAEDIIARYDSAIFYDDYIIGRLIEKLEEKKLMEDTYIFIFSDHGESMGEHDIFFNHHTLYDSSTKAPLIIVGPNIPRGVKIEALTQHEDIVPTTLSLLNIEFQEDSFDGKSVLPLLSGKQKEIKKAIFMEEADKMRKSAIRTRDFKYITANSKEDAFCSLCNNFHGGIEELYNLKKDPSEGNNIANSEKSQLIKMKKLFEKEIISLRKMNEKRKIRKLLSNSGKIYKAK